MGLGAKLNFAFFSVIVVMVGTHAGMQVLGERNSALADARRAVKPAIEKLKNDTKDIQVHNEAMADKLATDPAFASAFASQNRNAISAAIRSFADRNGVSGYVTVFDREGKVFYSTDSPSRTGYAPHDIADDIRGLIRDGKVWYGPAAPTITDTLSIIGMVPVKSGGVWSGAVAVCEPINSEFLTGIKKKVELSDDGTPVDVELLMYSQKEGRVTAMTPGLVSKDDGFVASLNREGLKGFKEPETEKNGRLWRDFKFASADNHVTAYILASAPMPDTKRAYTVIAGQAGISAFVAFILSLIFSAGIAGGTTRAVRLLIQRSRDLAANRQNLPSVDELNGDFLELAEVIDTAVTQPRITVKSLQTQMGKHQDDLAEKQRLVDEANLKVEAINRQLSVQSKQLSEVSKQINYANTQSILLQQKLASVLQISTEGFLVLDPFGNVLAANPTFLNWAGTNEAEIAGRFCFDLVRKPGDPKNGNHSAFSMHGNRPTDLISQFYPEGIVYKQYEDKGVEVLAHLQPVMTDDQNIQGYIMVLRDKTLHSEAARLRNEMVAILQESIRAPLATAEQKWQGVLSATRQTNNSMLGTALVDLHLTYQQLLGMVDSLLMMHTGIVPTSPVIREQVSITRLVSESLEQCAQLARNNQIMLDYKTVTGLPTTAIDQHIVRDTLIQLLERLIMVTAPGGRVRVESVSKGSEIRVSLFSSGPALPQVEIEDMFAGFIQGKHSEDSYSQRFAMYLCRNNLERIGCRIWAESDRGTYVYIILPIQ